MISGGAWSATAQAVNFLLSILLIPLVQKTFGVEILGIWLATTTLIVVLSIADFGIGNAAIAILTKLEDGLRDVGVIEIAMAATFLTVILAGLVYGCLSLVTYFEFWPALLNYSGDGDSDNLGRFFSIFTVYIAATLPLSIVERLQIGQQKMYIPRSLEVVGGCVALVSCPLVIYADGNLGELFLARFLPYSALRVLNSGTFWFTSRYRLNSVSLERIRGYRRQLLIVGSSFFSMSFASAISISSDPVLVSYFLGADRVPEYSVPLRLFFIPSLLVGLFTLALWPAYSQAMRDTDTVWVRRTYLRSVVFAVLTTVPVCIFLFIVSPHIIPVWIGSELPLPKGMLIAQSAWVLLSVLGGITSPLLNAAGKEKLLAKLSIWMALVNIPLSIFLINILGPQGAMWGSVVAAFAFFTMPALRVALQIVSGDGSGGEELSLTK
ncbi:hypothetical protein A3734_14380 [Sulfitobacter sp. HI0054]|nr:hypothetical protein A3734_14380 [Sulfitobacter sp. HI0054]